MTAFPLVNTHIAVTASVGGRWPNPLISGLLTAFIDFRDFKYLT